MRSPARASGRASTRPVRRILLLVGTCAVLGLLVGQGLGSPAFARAGSPAVGHTSLRHAPGGNRNDVATSSGTHIEILRHAIDRSLVRRTQPWALDGILVRLVVAGIAGTLLVGLRARRRRRALHAELPARAPPLLAFG